MPFGGLLTIGLTAGTGLFNGIMGKNAADNAASTQSDAEKQLLALINQKLPEANQLVSEGTTGGNDILSKFYQENMGLLAPYLKAGAGAEDQLSEALKPGGQLNTPATADQILAQDPGYQFRLQQGQLALERSAAAKGGAASGGALKALTQYGQDYASGEYNNAFQRYNTTQSNLFNRLQTLAGTGLSAAGTGVGAGTATAGQESGNVTQGANTQAQNILQALGIQGNAITGAANATASGYVGGTNALTSGITGGVNSGLNAVLLQKLLAGSKNPTDPNAVLDGGIP